MKKFFKNLSTEILNKVPSEMAPSNQYAKAVAASIALAVTANRDFDNIDYGGISAFITNHSDLRGKDLLSRTMDFFALYVSELQVADVEEITFTTEQVNLISVVRKCPEEHIKDLRAVITQLSNATTNTDTAQILARLL